MKGFTKTRFFSQGGHSLKGMLITFLILSSLIPLVLIGVTSYYTIYSISTKQVDSAIKSNLHQVMVELDNGINNIYATAYQLTFDSETGAKVWKFASTKSIYEKYEMMTDLRKTLTLLPDSNKAIGTMFFYSPSRKEIWFENISLKRDFKFNNLPVLFKKGDIAFYGPHITGALDSNSLVFSVLRKVDPEAYNMNDCYIYVETEPALLNRLFNNEKKAFDDAHLILNDKGIIVYSDIPGEFPVGTRYEFSGTGNAKKKDKGYYLFSEKSDQDWQVITAVKASNYNGEKYQWLIKCILLSIFSLITSAILAIAIWKKVYKPIRKIGKEIKFVAENKFDSEISPTGVEEFDGLLDSFQEMKGKVASLLNEIELKEKRKRRIEVEKLLAQINPHFLHNSLNTIQWIARMNGQEEIDKLVTLLTRVLHYNLGKKGWSVTIGQELDILKDYVELNRMRYDYQFEVKVKADPETLNVIVPRFILQPLVENAIFHGLKNQEGEIEVNILRMDKEYVKISVKDNGVGMSREQLEELLAENGDNTRRTGLGIGVSYVKRMIGVYFGGEAELRIESILGQGTEFIIKLPISYDPNHNA